MGALSLPWGMSTEEIYVLGTGWDVKATGHKRSRSVITTRRPTGRWDGPTNVYGHQTPKPVELMRYLVERCPPGVVADPFAGAGATLLSCKLLGREAIGVELDESHCETIAKRLEGALASWQDEDNGGTSDRLEEGGSHECPRL